MEYRKNSGTLSLSRGDIHYEVYGQNHALTPIVVCQLPTAPFHYLYLFKELAHQHPVYFFQPQEQDSLAGYAAQLGEVITALHLPAPHLVSHSFAAAYALMHSFEHPVASLTLLSPVLSTKLWERDLAVYGKQKCKALIEQSLPAELQETASKFLHIPFEFQLMNQLHRIKVPTYISTGQFDLVSPATASAIHNKIDPSHLEIFSNTSHFHFLEAKEEFRPSHSHWLKSIEKESRSLPQIMNL